MRKFGRESRLFTIALCLLLTCMVGTCCAFTKEMADAARTAALVECYGCIPWMVAISGHKDSAADDLADRVEIAGWLNAPGHPVWGTCAACQTELTNMNTHLADYTTAVAAGNVPLGYGDGRYEDGGWHYGMAEAYYSVGLWFLAMEQFYGAETEFATAKSWYTQAEPFFATAEEEAEAALNNITAILYCMECNGY